MDNVECPYCGESQRIELHQRSMYPWAHPVDGVCPRAPRTLKLYKLGTAKLFDVKPIEGTLESYEECSCCGYCFHILFFPIPPESSRQARAVGLSRRIDEMQTWPFNFSILFQLAFSLILPVLLFSLELVAR